MPKRKYYSIRTGRNPRTDLDPEILRRLFLAVFQDFQRREYFVEAFGFACVDQGDIPGTLGPDLDAAFVRHLRKTEIWPIPERCATYSEDDLFDVVEFLFDHISKPVNGWFHDYSACGMHWNEFDSEAAKREYAAEINDILSDYKPGYMLSTQGEVLLIPEAGFEHLIGANLPQHDPANVEHLVRDAISKFRRSRASLSERRDAIRDLVAVLEFLRPQLKEVLLSNDESDLFNIANNFGIRHHRPDQKTDYDEAIWYSWMFYYYLATIHACVRLIAKAKL